MADMSHDLVTQLAEQISEGFAALSGEYQVLFNQQRQLESKLSWAKQQTCSCVAALTDNLFYYDPEPFTISATCLKSSSNVPTADDSQYLDLLKRISPDTLSQNHLTFLHDLEHVPTELSRHKLSWIDDMGQSDEVERKRRAYAIRQAESAATSLRGQTDTHGVKIWSGPSADRVESQPSQGHPCDADMGHLERDFTTPGTPSRLGCPFPAGVGRRSSLATPRSSPSRVSFGRRSKRPSFNDPIRAEICGNDIVAVSASVSIEGSAAVCPIRFMDQHKPEEVAKYFENHKHELPRSHEVCIKRFQSNAESIEQLDRKYGNLVSMIQGLGEKHQAWLPAEPDEDEVNPDEAIQADTKVGKWAEEVTDSLRNPTPDEEERPDEVEEDARSTRFDRPFKEIRVGESPSRPWGIQIPARYTNDGSSSSVGSAPTASPPPFPLNTDQPIGITPQKSGKCPFDHRAMAAGANPIDTPKAMHPEATPYQTPAAPSHPLPSEPKFRGPSSPDHTEQPKRSDDAPRGIPQMVFNGPVFLGYPPDQLMAIFQNSNLSGMMR
ncbi:hypothetical protein P154DRAFT_536502 [Amniculicola lignicola CBS 123094]|uniref:Uncharacterized protein n=1 Tax=Amniculicola lignicola CBS 123094 TaxID=1392246 RepID=A0A6A5W8Q4_9PLEO|nr:hypothetical protein P154DRAFT_536502 [Amniculicola lignicola CBS 123094]